ncbi:hypothetical protein EDC94DRAFT_609149 [Helicostylum pulchrum]|nr:hypothetical protein EDC94DRAFT_609149 [Helicostylum pulchrum]
MYTRYLIDYFPNQLNDSSISISRQNIFSWIDIVGMELALKLMEKIGRIKETYISFGLNDRYEVQTNDETKMTKYFRLLNVFRGNRQTHCTAYFSELIDVKKTDFSFSYDTNGRLFATYGLHDDDFLGPNGDLDLPDKISSTIGPEIFNILKFNISSIYDDVIYRTLSYSLLSCSKLEKFYFTYEYPYRCLVSSLGYKHREDPTSSTLTKGNFNFLEMAFISSAQCYFDLVTAYLHGIEALSLKMYDWNRANNDSVLDLRGFKKLKNFTYKSVTEYSENNDSDQENDFVLIRSTNGKERYYYLDEEKNKNPQVEYNKNPTTPCLTVFCDASVSFDFRQDATFNKWVTIDL